MNVTRIRKALEELLSEATGCQVQVWLAPTEYTGASYDLKLGVRVFVGTADGEAGVDSEQEAKVDELFEQVPPLVQEARLEEQGIGAQHVASCAGHRLYGQAPGEPPLVGTEFTILLMAS